MAMSVFGGWLKMAFMVGRFFNGWLGVGFFNFLVLGGGSKMAFLFDGYLMGRLLGFLYPLWLCVVIGF